MSQLGDNETVVPAKSEESIDAFLDREFSKSLTAVLSTSSLPEEVQKALVEAAGRPSPDVKAWRNAVDPPQKAVASG